MDKQMSEIISENCGLKSDSLNSTKGDRIVLNTGYEFRSLWPPDPCLDH